MKRKYEVESDRPENWADEVILKRNDSGTVEEVTVPDDPEEVTDDVGND